MALREEGIETIMVNCNPETVSTDYDTSDRLYFEPLTLEDVLAICDVEKPWGVIVQFGGQTPLKLAVALAAGRRADPRHQRRRDRSRRGSRAVRRGADEARAARAALGHRAQPRRGARASPTEIGFPVLVRPSYVLGGRAMERDLRRARARGLLPARAVAAAGPAAGSDESSAVGFPLLIDQFLADAIELDVDVVADRTGAVVVGGVMEHIEEAGIHSGDSACALPPYSLPADIIDEVKRQARMLALELGVVGLMNVQFAVHGGDVYVLEVNPRASRTVPFVVEGDRQAAREDRREGDGRPDARRARR